MYINKHISRLSLGTAQFGMNYGITNQQGKISIEDMREMLIYANAKGLNFLDTASVYASSEINLGKIGLQKWNVISKIPPVSNKINDEKVSNWIINSVEESLSKLKLKSLYAILIHNPKDLLGKQGKEIFDSLKLLKKMNYVNKVGISTYGDDFLNEIIPHISIDLIQTTFNIFDQRLKKSGWLKKIKEFDIELHARSVFLQGLLLMKKENRPKQFTKWTSFWKKWDEFIKKKNKNSYEICLNFVMSHLEIDKIIIGVDNLAQIKNLIKSAKPINFGITEDFSCSDLDLINPQNWKLN